jgi:hypothetical protein
MITKPMMYLSKRIPGKLLFEKYFYHPVFKYPSIWFGLWIYFDPRYICLGFSLVPGYYDSNRLRIVIIPTITIEIAWSKIFTNHLLSRKPIYLYKLYETKKAYPTEQIYKKLGGRKFRKTKGILINSWFELRHLWIGVYWNSDCTHSYLYIYLFPCIQIRITWVNWCRCDYFDLPPIFNKDAKC